MADDRTAVHAYNKQNVTLFWGGCLCSYCIDNVIGVNRPNIKNRVENPETNKNHGLILQLDFSRENGQKLLQDGHDDQYKSQVN